MPVALSGTRGFCGPVRVRVGKPFFLTAAGKKPSREEIAAGGEKMMAAIAALMEDGASGS